MPRLQPLDEGFVCRSRRRLTFKIYEVALMIEVAAQCKTRPDNQSLLLQQKSKLVEI